MCQCCAEKAGCQGIFMFEQIVKRADKRGTLQEVIYGELRLALMKGRFDPGQAMTVHALAEAFGESTMPVREALRQLVAENGLSAQPNSTIQVPAVTEARLRDLCTARLALEGLATPIAFQHHTPTEPSRCRQSPKPACAICALRVWPSRAWPPAWLANASARPHCGISGG